MKVQGVLILCILLFLLCSGCIDNSKQESVKPVITAQPQETEKPVPQEKTTHQVTITPETENKTNIFDQSPIDPPADLAVSVTAQKDPIYSTIVISFNGGKGQDLVQALNTQTTLSTGEIIENSLGKKKGDEVVVNGTRGSDRVQVTVTYMTGETYLVLDTKLEQNRTGAQSTGNVSEKKMNTSEEGLYPGPIIQPPNSLSVSVDVMKEPIYRVITGTFRGGHGQFLVSRVEMRAVLGSGESVTRLIPSDIGATAEIQGSDGIDRVQVVAFFKNGDVYKIFEKAFGSRG